jgi:hypothetical protein
VSAFREFAFIIHAWDLGMTKKDEEKFLEECRNPLVEKQN